MNEEIMTELATMQKRFREIYGKYIGLISMGHDGIQLSETAFEAMFAGQPVRVKQYTSGNLELHCAYRGVDCFTLYDKGDTSYEKAFDCRT